MNVKHALFWFLLGGYTLFFVWLRPSFTSGFLAGVVSVLFVFDVGGWIATRRYQHRTPSRRGETKGETL